MRTPHLQRWKRFAKNLWREFQNDHILDLAAVLAFFFVLAIFPAAIVALSLQPYVTIPHLQQATLDLLHQVLPTQSANLFDSTIHVAAAESTKGLLTFGLLFAVWSGSAGVAALMDQLNIIHDIAESRPYWKARSLAILLMFVFAGLAVGSLTLVIFGGVVQSWLASLIGWNQPLLLFFAILRWIILAAALLLAIAIAYRFGPDANVKFRFLSPGNLTAAALIALASVAFRFYVSRFGTYSATYGSLAAIIILMLWMYMTGVALLIGCEINTLLLPQDSKQSDSTAPTPPKRS